MIKNYAFLVGVLVNLPDREGRLQAKVKYKKSPPI